MFGPREVPHFRLLAKKNVSTVALRGFRRQRGFTKSFPDGALFPIAIGECTAARGLLTPWTLVIP